MWLREGRRESGFGIEGFFFFDFSRGFGNVVWIKGLQKFQQIFVVDFFYLGCVFVIYNFSQNILEFIFLGNDFICEYDYVFQLVVRFKKKEEEKKREIDREGKEIRFVEIRIRCGLFFWLLCVKILWKLEFEVLEQGGFF